MEKLFTRFITERRFLKNISPQTEYSYNNARRALFHLYGSDFDVKELSRERLNAWITAMRRKGLSPGACNVYIRTVNAFLNWLDQEGLAEQKFRLQLVKEERKVVATFTPQQIQALLHYKPKRWAGRRMHTLVALLLDTGLRIGEALSLRVEDLDLDNLVLKVKGKGGRHRLVPFSLEMRKLVYHLSKEGGQGLLFHTQSGHCLTQRNVLRDLKELCRRLGISGVRVSPHTFRHTFAVSYLRNGGNLFFLSRILGHTSVKTTERYLQSLGVDDLQAVHSKLSVLGMR